MTTIPYHEAKKIIDDEINIYSKRFLDETAPSFDMKLNEGTTEINFAFSQEHKYEIIKTIANIPKEIYVKPHFRDLAFRDKDYKFSLSIYPETSLFTGKDLSSIHLRINGDMSTEELNAVMDMYRIGNPILEKKMSCEDELRSYGVTIYDSKNPISWDYIAGYEDVKKEIENTVLLPLKNSEIYSRISKGTRKVFESIKPKAVLFEGPPGTGKTTMARIIAHESEGKMIYVPIESIVSKWYGQSEQNLSKIFEISSKIKNPILFLDEIDALGMSRDSNSYDASRRVLSTLLRKIDGFEQNENTILIGATNRKQDLDSALISRFDVGVYFRLPEEDERKLIFENYAKQLKDKELEQLAQESKGISGRNIKDVCEHAERSWASKYIRKEVSCEIPNINEYLTSLKQRQSSGI